MFSYFLQPKNHPKIIRLRAQAGIACSSMFISKWVNGNLYIGHYHIANTIQFGSPTVAVTCHSLSEVVDKLYIKETRARGLKERVVVVVSQFNGTSTPKGSYSAKTGDNNCNVNSSHYSLGTALCESNSLLKEREK